MNKMMVGFATVALLGGGLCAQGTGDVVSVDSISIMQKSVEGKQLAEKIRKEVDQFQEELKLAQQDLSQAGESLSKQSKVLSKDSLQEKAEEITQRRKEMERKFADKEETLRARIQKYQVALHEKQRAVINEVFEKEQWSMLIDKNTPGLLCVSTAIDRTDKVLKAVDAKYLASNGKKTSTTVAKATTKPTAKPELKIA
jgi:outer membrane protein